MSLETFNGDGMTRKISISEKCANTKENNFKLRLLKKHEMRICTLKMKRRLKIKIEDRAI